MKLQDMLQERNKLAHDMRELNGLAEKEERALKPEEKQKWDEMCDRLGFLDQTIERHKTLDGLPSIEEIKEKYKKSEEEQRQGSKPTYADAFGALIRSTEPGHAALSEEHRQAIAEMRVQSKATDAAGGYLVPDDFVQMLIKARKQFGGIERYATVITTGTGRRLPMPTNDDTGNAAVIIAENATDSEQDTSFGEVEIGAYKYTTRIIKVSFELLQDNAFNLEAYLADLMGERLGRGQSAHFAAGTGTGQPEGLNAATSGVTAALVAGVSYNEILDLKHSVDPAYRANARFAFNDSTFLAIKKLEDADGRKLWQPDIAATVPATLDGSPYVIDQGLPDMAASAKPMVYGDLSGLMIRRVAGIRMKRLVELYAENDQIGFVGLERADAKIINSSKIRAMTMAAA